MNEAIRVQFIHGLEGSPQGSKAKLIAANFTACTPVMDTSDFEASVATQRQATTDFQPHVLVGSSFGGAVAVALLTQGDWKGPTLLLAQAAIHYNADARLPSGPTAPVTWIVHGLADSLIDPEQSRRLAQTGDPARTRLIEVEDDHPLHASVASGDLIRWIDSLAELA